MHKTAERIEVRLSPEIVELLREEARHRGVTVDQIVREAVEFLLTEDRRARLRAAEDLFRINAPVNDWPTMEREIHDAHIEKHRYRFI